MTPQIGNFILGGEKNTSFSPRICAVAQHKHGARLMLSFPKILGTKSLVRALLKELSSVLARPLLN